ncbi:hypothetical protein T484DRAFT_1765552 [Baffinella frigidus]|nr:hypothetical protein T484DRAFT_1765552 [Cryptophyta sp. CCMP2293]
MDVVTTRIITQKKNKGEEAEGLGLVEMPKLEGEEVEGLGLVEMTKLVYAEGGVGAFYQGAAERIVFWSPAVGIFLAVYCSLRQVALSYGI